MVRCVGEVLTKLNIEAPQQLEIVKALHKSGAYGNVPEVTALNDQQAHALLHEIQFKDTQQAADWLKVVTGAGPEKDMQRALLHEQLKQLPADYFAAPATQPSLENVEMVPLEKITAAPGRFQFRTSGDEKNGTVECHRIQAEHWEPLLHGDPVLLWEDKQGQKFVVDGHHRFQLATQLTAEGKPAPKALAARTLKEAEGYTEEDAKIIGAYVNLAREFRKDELVKTEQEMRDASAVFRAIEEGRVNPKLLPEISVEGQLADAQDAASLSAPAYTAVAQGTVPVAVAAEIARSTEDETKQSAVMRLVQQKLGTTPAPGAATIEPLGTKNWATRTEESKTPGCGCSLA